MRPWLIASGDFTTLGGMDRANHGLARFLARTGRPVHLVTHRVAADLEHLPGLTVHPVARPLGAHLLGAPLLSRAAARCARDLGDEACVVTNGGNATVAGATWIHYLHATYEPTTYGSLRSAVSSRLGRRYFLRQERAALDAASIVICNSRRTAVDVEREYHVDPARMRVVYYGIDSAEFRVATAAERVAARAGLGIGDRRMAIFIGALGDRRKGFDVLFDAWCMLARDPAWDVDLFVAGDGGEKDAWIARSKDADVAARMHFLGFRTDIGSLLAAADVLVHPARYEAYGLGVHEAICRGVPAIVSAGAGIAERYPKTLAGLIVSDPPKAETLVTTLRAWRAHQAIWLERTAAFARCLAARSWDDMAAEIVAAVE